MTGLGVDLHPVYQRGTNALPGVEYGWIKMADGAKTYSMPADALAKLFRDHGLPFGGYEFAQPGTDGARAFDVLWAECRRLGATGVTPAVDIEGPGWTPLTAAVRGQAFCMRARAAGVRPAVYMDLSLLQAVRPDLWAEKPVIWAPRYGAKPEVGGRYTGHYDVHQYTSSGTLPGSAGAVDWNQAYTTAHLLGDQTSGEAADLDANQDQLLRELHVELTGAAAPIYPGTGYVPVRRLIAELGASVTALSQAVQAATKDPGITLDAMRQIVNDAVAQHVQITGTVEITPKAGA